MLFLSFVIAGELWQQPGYPTERTSFLLTPNLPTNCENELKFWGIHVMKFILFYADIMYPEIAVNVLTSYTRDILQSAF